MFFVVFFGGFGTNECANLGIQKKKNAVEVGLEGSATGTCKLF